MTKTRSQKRKQRKAANTRALHASFRQEVVTHNRPMPSREEVRETVRAARARHLEMQASPMMDIPMLGEQAGRAIAIGADDETEAAQLWETFKAMDAAHETFSRRILNRPRFPAVAKMEYLPETFETRPDDRPDPRTPDEMDADAKRRWCEWCTLSDRLLPPLHAALHMALRQKVVLHQGRSLTGTGRLFLVALRRLDGMRRTGVDGLRKAV